MWCIPQPSAEFVERMEDVLDIYKRPYNKQYPVVCFDETTRQLNQNACSRSKGEAYAL